MPKAFRGGPETYRGQLRVCVGCGRGYETTGRRQMYCTPECWRECNPQREYHRVKMRMWRKRIKTNP